MVSEFSFHIRNAHPGDMAAVLATLDTCPGLRTIVEIIEQAENLGFTIRDRLRLEALMTARDLELVEREQNILTDSGRTLTRLEINKPELFTDILHGLQYGLWDGNRPTLHCFSWSYRALCQMIWQSGTMIMESRQDIASKVERQAQITFDHPSISFSQKSIGGALLWLIELTPPVLNEDGMRFTRRTFCPPELFVLGVNFAYQVYDIDYGVNLLLSDERRDIICQVCLLEPTSFDRVLEYAVAQFDYLEKGLGGGWGQYLILHHAPKLEDFV